MNIQELTEYLEKNKDNEWWYKAALGSMERGHWTPITERDNDDLYLARFWLSAPIISSEYGRTADFESARSTLLHCFIRPDTDKALHDHPWDFTTTILAGSYQEHLPTLDWLKGEQDHGPAWGDNIVTRSAGETIHHSNSDLHCIGSVEKHTWSLVTTRDRTSTWGFHPEGQIWERNDIYLMRQKITK